VTGTLTGLEQVELFRPDEYDGLVEVQVGAPAARRWPTRICGGLEISLLIGPTHEATIQRRQTETPGKVTFVQLPGTVWSAPQVGGGFFSIDVAPQLFARFLAEWPKGSSLPGPSQVVTPGLLDVFWSTHRVLRQPGNATTRSEALVRLVSQVLETLTGVAPPDVDCDGVSRARDLIHDCPESAPTLEALAAEAELTPFELARAFRRRYGVGPSGYRRALQVTRARWMLFGGRAIEEVVAQLGFASADELRRCFVAQVGLEPEQYAGEQRHVQPAGS
jgi:AraC-like DNA-binding protein